MSENSVSHTKIIVNKMAYLYIVELTDGIHPVHEQCDLHTAVFDLRLGLDGLHRDSFVCSKRIQLPFCSPGPPEETDFIL